MKKLAAFLFLICSPSLWALSFSPGGSASSSGSGTVSTSTVFSAGTDGGILSQQSGVVNSGAGLTTNGSGSLTATGNASFGGTVTGSGTGTFSTLSLTGDGSGTSVLGSTLAGVNFVVGSSTYTLNQGITTSSTAITVQGNTFNGNNNLVKLDSTSKMPTALSFLAGTSTAAFSPCGSIYEMFTSSATGTGTAEQTLWSWPLYANVLSSSSNTVHIFAHGATVGSLNTTMKLYFGSTVCATPAINNNGTSSWELECSVTATGTNTQISRGLYTESATGAFPLKTTPSETTNAAITLKMTGTDGTSSAGAITLYGVSVSYCGHP